MRSVSGAAGILAAVLLAVAVVDAVIYIRGIVAGESRPHGPIDFADLMTVWFGSLLAAVLSSMMSGSGESGRARRRWLLACELAGAPVVLFGAYIAGLNVMEPGS